MIINYRNISINPMKLRNTVLLMSFLLISMTPLYADSYVLITDKYWNTMLQQEYEPGLITKINTFIEERTGLKIENNIRVDGTKIRLDVIENDSVLGSIEKLSSEIRTSAEDTVLLSPYISSAAEELASMFPDKKIIALKAEDFHDSEPLPETGDNLFRLIWDYEQAFISAGEYAGKLEKPLIGVFYTGTPESRNQYEAFMEGVDSVNSALEKDILKFSSIDDKNVVRKFTEKIENHDIFSAAVFAGPYNPDILAGEEGAGTEDILTANTLIWPNSGFQVKGSVELTPLTVIGYGIREFSAKDAENSKKIYADFILY